MRINPAYRKGRTKTKKGSGEGSFFLSLVFEPHLHSTSIQPGGHKRAQTSFYLFDLKRQERVGIRRNHVTEF